MNPLAQVSSSSLSLLQLPTEILLLICESKASTSSGGRDYVKGDSVRNIWFISRMAREFLGITPNPNTAQPCMGDYCRRSPQPIFLLMSMATNLTSAEIHVRRAWKAGHLARKRRDGTLNLRVTFPGLTRLDLVAHGTGTSSHHRNWSFKHGFINGILASTPNLKSLRLKGFGHLVHDEGAHLPALPRLATLHVQGTIMDPTSLQRIIRTAPGLRRLESLALYLSYETGPSQNRPIFPRDAFVSCLGRFSSLKVFGINHRWEPSKELGLYGASTAQIHSEGSG
ncbi:uncharacterized protein B0T15DRAFT_562582 [Chaetomium strumarium]|uniref:F-box domain-containing protein n=1 Tax=Chaetomium strumarium TaxID=1170767 RepID=A0AAJ0GMF0_9PEZI|nr:hypothetical protein B0T15DRAFT_562582 [Chaetomium strumarium]